ncbi:MAG: PIN domain-containing protein [Bryobacteraceae bacterium]
MKTLVLDSWGILEWIQGRQPASGLMDTLFAEGETGAARLLISAINVGEVYYFLRKKHSEKLARDWRESAPTLPVTIEVPSLEDIWSAATLKGLYPISYADAFAAALAQKYNCPVVTGDVEFKSMDQLELDWIGR